VATSQVEFPAPDVVDEHAPPRSQMSEAIRRYRANPVGMVGFAALVVFVLLGVFGPWLAPQDPGAVSRDILDSPSSAHFFGTDNIGKDVFSGVLAASRVSMTVGIFTAIFSLVVGVLAGGLAGYYGGKIDAVVMRISEFFQVIPGLILALVTVAMIGPSLTVIVVVLSITTWPQTARIVRAQFLSLKEREFVEAARSIGFGHRYIIRSEVLPNAMPPAIIAATLVVGRAILLEAGLSFLGLGDPNNPSWGEMLNRAQPYLSTAWWMSVFPGLAILLVVLAFNLVGDALNDALDPEGRQV
jgi:peptide/nickel transport system permease protein